MSAKYGNDTSKKVHKPHKCEKRRPKLTELDKDLIELLKRETPYMSGKELQDKVKKYFPGSGDVSVSTINRSISRDLNFTYKRIKRPYSVRYTHVRIGMLYSKAYIDFCQTKRSHQIKFMDESVLNERMGIHTKANHV